jgi:5-formyltetrahydrofolate cyclo-ligase
MRHHVLVPVDDSKAELRTRMRAARAARGDDDRRAAAETLARHAAAVLPSGPATISCYLSLPAEPGTGPLIAAVHAAGMAVVVPRIAGRDLHWVPMRPGGELARGPLGISEPTGEPIDPAELAELAVMLVPATAVDRSGHRLGQGGGYYDRALAAIPSHADGGPLRVAVVFDDEVVDVVPVESHDCPVDAVLTPSGIARFD